MGAVESERCRRRLRSKHWTRARCACCLLLAVIGWRPKAPTRRVSTNAPFQRREYRVSPCAGVRIGQARNPGPEWHDIFGQDEAPWAEEETPGWGFWEQPQWGPDDDRTGEAPTSDEVGQPRRARAGDDDVTGNDARHSGGADASHPAGRIGTTMRDDVEASWDHLRAALPCAKAISCNADGHWGGASRAPRRQQAEVREARLEFSGRPQCVPAKAFAGQQIGYVFTKRDDVVGYKRATATTW